MCTEIYKKLQTKRMYGDLGFLLRTSGLPSDEIGTEMIKYAILAYLHDSSLDREMLIKEAIANVPAAIHGILSNDTEEAFYMMKDTLESLNTKHSEKIYDDNIVEKFIHNIADEVRMTELMQIRIDSFEAEGKVTHEQRNIFIQTTLRKLRKPKDNFKKEVLNWVAGKYEYDNVTALVEDLYSIVAIAESENNSANVFERLEEMQNLDGKRIWTSEEKQLFNQVVKEIEKLVNNLIKTKDTVSF